MKYEEVYRVPDSVLKGKKGARYLTREDRRNLEKYCLLNFKRERSFIELADYPAMGASQERLRTSVVTGPNEIAQSSTSSRSNGFERKIENIELLLREEEIPVGFETVFLARYGTKTDVNSMDHTKIVAKPDKSKLLEIGKEAFDKLRELNPLKTIEDGKGYRATFPWGFIYLRAKENGVYPTVESVIFGKNIHTADLFAKLGLPSIRDTFPNEAIHAVAIENCLQEGLAFNLGKDGFDLRNIDLKKLPENFIF